MTRTLIPRAGCCSAKVVATTDFEKFWSCDIIANYLQSGFTLSAQCPNVLAVDIAAGIGRLEGLYFENTTCCAVTSLTANDENFIYAGLTRGACCNPTGWTLSKNITGVTPACSVLLGIATTGCTTVTGVSTRTPKDNILSICTISCCQTVPINTCICDYTTPDAAVSSSNSTSLPAGLILYYNFDETSGAILNRAASVCSPDDLGPCYDGTNTGADYCATAKLGSAAITFIRANCDRVDVDSLIPFGSSDFTISVWFKTSATCNSNYFLYASDSCGSRIDVNYNPSSDTMQFRANDGTNSIDANDSVVNINDGNWHLVSSVRDGTTFRLYVDGSERSTDTGCPSTLGSVTGSDDILGARSSSGNLGHDGDMDDVSFWNRALSATEINCCLWNSGCGAIASTVTSATSADRVVDDSTASFWQSTSSTNPNIYVDMGSVKDMVGVAIYPHANTTVTEIKIRASTDATFTDAENTRVVAYAKLTAETWNFIRFSRLEEDRRYLQIYGTDSGAKILSIKEIKVLIPTNIDRSHIHYDISTSDPTLALDGTPS